MNENDYQHFGAGLIKGDNMKKVKEKRGVKASFLSFFKKDSVVAWQPVPVSYRYELTVCLDFMM